MKLQQRTILLTLTLAAILWFALWLSPRLLSLYYQVQGGELLEQALAAIKSPVKNPFPCEIQPNEAEQVQSQVLLAISKLQNATRLNSKASQAYLLLGRAHCLVGKPENAIKSYIVYTSLRPKNPLGYLELGFASEATCLMKGQTNHDNSDLYGLATREVACKDEEVLKSIIDNWNKAGVRTDHFLDFANESFLKHEYRDAEEWYQLSYRFGKVHLEQLPMSTKFKWSVSAVLAGHPLPNQFDSELPIFDLINQVKVEADGMRWVKSSPEWNLDYGDQVGKFSTKEPGIGILYWNGSVVAFVRVERSGEYRISLRAKNVPPAPTILQIEDNLRPLTKVELDNEDLSFEEFSYKTFLDAGMHLIGLNFLNNGIERGQDRDAYVDWLQIQKE